MLGASKPDHPIVEGCRRLWSVMAGLIAMICAVPIYMGLAPLLSRFEEPVASSAPSDGLKLLALILAVIALVVVWRTILRPIHTLYRYVGGSGPFAGLMLAVGLKVWPFALVEATAFALMLFDLPGHWGLVQAGCLFAAIDWVERRREAFVQPIAKSLKAQAPTL